jgi:hypothetical protein
MILNPRQTFNKSLLSKGWADFVASDQFEKAAQAAMWAAETQLGHPADMGTAAANEWKRQGMRLFLSQLVNLCDPEEKKPATPSRQQLDHTV